jgi:hypothetical protein
MDVPRILRREGARRMAWGNALRCGACLTKDERHLVPVAGPRRMNAISSRWPAYDG